MASCPVIKFTKKYTITLIIGFCFALPLIIVHVYPTDSPQTYVFEGRVIEKLGETLEGKLRYYQVKHIQGNVPAEEFVITVDDSYTRGGQSPDYVGSSIWMMGDLMKPEEYYGDQYLFYEKPQIYVSQVRTGWLWPDQVSGLTILYGSPATSLLAPLILLMNFSGDVPILSLRILGFKSILIAVTVYFMDRCRKKVGYRTMIVIGYCILAILSTAITLGDLY